MTDVDGVVVTQSDREAARQFVFDEWPSWDTDHETVQAELTVRFARHRIEATRAGWQRIETWEGQPTGEAHPVLLCVSDGGVHPPVIGEAWYCPSEGANDSWRSGWWWANTGPGDYYSSSIADGNHGAPTHWQPLPTPPSENPA